MAFWCRIRKAKLISLSTQFKRCYFHVPGPCLVNRIASHARARVLENPTSVIRKTQIEFANNARFFAAPVQAKLKPEEKDTSGPRLNKQITAEFIRLVAEEGHRVVSRSEALECATRLNLDLVEVQRNAKPPVCKLMDYHKEKYKQQTKEKDRAKSKSEVILRKGDCKEVRFSGKTEQKDLQMKADTVKRLMERGYRVKCMAMGTEDQDLGGLLSRLSVLIEDVSIVESGPRVEKKQAYAIVRHVKFGPSKKGSGKKASKGVGAMSSEVQTIRSSPPTMDPSMVNQTPIQFEEIVDHESGLETENEILSDEAGMLIPPSLEMSVKDIDRKNPTLSVLDANDDLDSVFDFSDEGNVAKRSGDVQMNYAPETDFMSPRPLADSTRTETVLHFPSEALGGTENGNRMEPRNKYPPAQSRDGKGTSARDSMRSGPQFLKQDKEQQFGLGVSPSTKETKRIGTDVSLPVDFKLPADDIPKQELRHSTPSSPASGYGIFNAPKVNGTSGKNGLPVEVNRYKKGNSFDSTRHPRPRGVSVSSSCPTSSSSNTDRSGRPGIDKGGQGKWGIFSRENSNVIPSQNAESKAKIHR